MHKEGSVFEKGDTVFYKPGQKEELLTNTQKENQTEIDIHPSGQDAGEFVRQETKILNPEKTIYEKANEGDIDEARHEVIYNLFEKALKMDKNSIGRMREDEVDPILAYHHLKQAKDLNFGLIDKMGV